MKRNFLLLLTGLCLAFFWGCSYTPERVVKYSPQDTFRGYGKTVEASSDSPTPETATGNHAGVFGKTDNIVEAKSIIAPPAAPSPTEKLAVMELEAIGSVDEALIEIMTNTLKDELQAVGNYAVVSREEIEALATRLAIQQQSGDCTSDECMADMGKALGTKLMVYGSLARIGSIYSISLRLLDTETKIAIRRVNERCKCSEEDLFGTVQLAADKLMGKTKQR